VLPPAVLLRVELAERAAYGAVQMQAKGQRKGGAPRMLVDIDSRAFLLKAQVLREKRRVEAICEWLRREDRLRERVPKRNAWCSLIPKWEERGGAVYLLLKTLRNASEISE
jgi:hypothetical protein